MVMKATLSKADFDSLPAHFKTEYKPQTDGTYILDVQEVGGVALENVTGLRSALASERTRANEAEKLTAAFKDIDPKAAKEAIEKAEQIKNWKPDEKTNEIIKNQVGQVEAKFKERETDLTKKMGSYRAQLEKTLVDSVIGEACNRHNGVYALLRPAIRERVKIEEAQDGSLAIRVLDERGQPLITRRPNSTDFMGIEEFVELGRTNPDLQSAYKAKDAAGSGDPAGNRRAGGSGGHQISEAEAANPAKYRAAKAAAERAGSTLQIV